MSLEGFSSKAHPLLHAATCVPLTVLPAVPGSLPISPDAGSPVSGKTQSNTQADSSLLLPIRGINGTDRDERRRSYLEWCDLKYRPRELRKFHFAGPGGPSTSWAVTLQRS